MLETATTGAQTTCPQCGSTIDVDPGYVTWCDRCHWNVRPSTPARPASFLASRYAEFGDALGRGLFEQLKASSSLSPKLTPSLVAAAFVATVVHLVALGCFVLGLVLIATSWPAILLMLLGIGFVLSAAYVAPRVGKPPRHFASRASFPALYEAVATVARAVGAGAPDVIVLDLSFNASYSRPGWRRRQVLTLGLPLLAVLDDREFVALVGHEMGHAVNGDHTRHFLIGSAINALERWYEILDPAPSRMHGQRGSAALAMLLLRPILRALAQVPRAIATLLLHLLWRDSQRAEYLADDLAARAAGTEAALSLLAKLQLHTLVAAAVQNVATGSSRNTILALLSKRCVDLPERERRRLDAVARLESSRLDATHPPSGFRIALLEARPIANPTVHVSGIAWRAVEQELASTEPRTTERLVDRYRSSLYRH